MSPLRTARRGWIAVAALSIAAACGARPLLGGPPPPAEVTGIRLSVTGAERAVLTLALRLPPLDSTEAQAVGVRWDLALQGRPFATGIAALSMPTGRDGEVVVSVPLTFLELPAAAADGRVEVAVRGRLTVRDGAGERVLPFLARARLRLEAGGG